MLDTSYISLGVNVIALILGLVSWIVIRNSCQSIRLSQNGYQSIHSDVSQSEEDDEQIQPTQHPSWYTVLTAFILLFSILGLAGSIGLLYETIIQSGFDWFNLPLLRNILALLTWALVTGISPWANKPIVAQESGHLALFFITISLSIAESLHLMSTNPFLLKSIADVLSLVKLGSSLFIMFTVGFFSDSSVASPQENVSKEHGTSVFSQMTFSWVSPLIDLGNKKALEQNDLPHLIRGDSSRKLMKDYVSIKRQNKSNSFYQNLFLLTRPLIFYQFSCAFTSAALTFTGPLFLFYIVDDIQRQGKASYQAWVMLFGLLLSTILRAVTDGQMYFTGRRVGTRIRSILIAEVYSKALRRAEISTSPDSKDGNASLGKIVTLMSVDTEQIRVFVSYWHNWFIAEPLVLILAVCALFAVIGWSAFAGLAVIVLVVPVSYCLGSLLSKIQDELMSNTDKRVSLVNEMLQGIRIIKYFAWEKSFSHKITEARNKELNSIVSLWTAYVMFENVGQGTGIAVSLVTFAVYVLVFGHTLDAATAFTSINLLRTVSGLVSNLPQQIMMIFRAKVSMERINSFLSEEELERFCHDSSSTNTDDDASDLTQEDGEADMLVGFVHAYYTYYSNTKDTKKDDKTQDALADEMTPLIGDAFESQSKTASFLLRDLHVTFPHQGLTTIVGSTGSGKSSLLLAMLGEMKRIQGSHRLSDGTESSLLHGDLSTSVAYVAQTAWLLNATVRDNILFGQPYDADRYQRVVHACALAKDLETFPGGDLTEIGEKGINMSGGQKQRISLARAAYSNASVVLLDDPLSAVDAPTARHLFYNCILDMMKGRTRVLVSHAVPLVVPASDYVVVLKNGELLKHGIPSDVVSDPIAEGVYGIGLNSDDSSASLESESTVKKNGLVPVANEPGTGTQLVEEEERAKGSVHWDVYKTYFLAAGGILFLVAFVAQYVFVRAAQLADDWWLKYWTDHSTQDSNVMSSFTSFGSPSVLPFLYTSTSFMSLFSTDNSSVQAWSNDTNSNMYYVIMYAVFGVGLVVAINFQILVILYGQLVASTRLHVNLLEAILRAPLRFFEVTPLGRILNRFSKDVGSVDSEVMESTTAFGNQIIRGCLTIFVISSLAPSFLLFVLPIMFIYRHVSRVYLNASRELKRLESLSRSPIYAQFSETLAGTATIRAYSSEKHFVTLNEQKVDANHESFFYMWAANRWLCFRTDVLSAIVVFVAGAAMFLANVGAGWTAMMITYALDFTDALLWAVRMHAEMEMSMNSVERVMEYTSVESEPPAVIEENRPDPEWPAKGAIQVRDLSVKYAPDLPDVLRGVSFDVLPSEKVAVVGRTGAGKSTLSLAFFRILPLSGGSIEIDGLDISKLGLFDLRSRLTIIPQDPILFAGTLRSNMDPLGEHDDAKIWQALKSVHFLESLQTAKPTVPSANTFSEEDIEDETSTITPSAVGASASASIASSLSLDSSVSENGSNFSQGQRQLLCLARALLRESRVLFLDEATASIDNETDARIQETIREACKSCTVVCIAHRLRTVIDYDKVLVLDKGQVREFGSPLELMTVSQEGIFKSMCEESGDFDELLEMARSASLSRSSSSATI